MGRQRNTSHMKEQEKSPEREVNEMGATKILDAEFNTVVKSMLKDLRRRMNDVSEKLNKMIVNHKKVIETIKKKKNPFGSEE